MKSYPKSRQREIVVQELENEVLIYDLKVNKAFCLNETAAAVWRECDGASSIAEIGCRASEKLKSPVAEELVWLAVAELKKDSLLAGDSADITYDFNGLSRREVIRKVGLASMIALPVISSLVAPTAAAAQSAGACVASGQSASGSNQVNFADCLSSATAKCCSGTAVPGSGLGNQSSCSVTCA